MQNIPPVLPTAARRNAVILKLLIIGALVVFLQGPLLMVGSLLDERQRRRQEAVADISQAWGQSQTVVGPVLIVPFTRTESVIITAENRQTRTVEKQEVEDYACILPTELDVAGEVDPIQRHRGIYVATLYSTRLRITGKFVLPNWDSLGVRTTTTVHWKRARVGIAMRDVRGVQRAIELTWSGQKVVLQPGAGFENAPAGLHAEVLVDPNSAQEIPFELDLPLNGMERIAFAPVGAQTTVKLASPWPDPSFGGAFLPTRSEVGPQGFSAQWDVSHYGRGYPQQWTRASALRPDFPKLEGSAFGVALVTPVDAYRTVERALKHSILFIALVFMAFFIFEAASSLSLHPLHYILVGAALCLFYLALLALSEFITVPLAYVSAAGASTLLVTLYSASILGGWRRAIVIGLLLAGVYGFLFFVLQMQDFALIAGTAALFVMLGAVMFVTRKVTSPDPGAAGQAV